MTGFREFPRELSPSERDLWFEFLLFVAIVGFPFLIGLVVGFVGGRWL